MRLLVLCSVAAFAASAIAQPNPFYNYQPLGQLKAYLQLSDSQLQTILANNDEYNRWSSQKQARIVQIQTEIAQETAKENLDPMALGVHYAEIETACREMKNQAAAYRSKNTDLLTGAQKAKLQTLEDALKLAPAISEAQYGNVIGAPVIPPYAFVSNSVAIGGTTGGILTPAGGCFVPFSNGIVRTGDFSPAPGANLIRRPAANGTASSQVARNGR